MPSVKTTFIRQTDCQAWKKGAIKRAVACRKTYSQERWWQEKKTAKIDKLSEILIDTIRSFTAGCPMKGILWTNLSLIKIRERLSVKNNILISCPVIKKLLKSCGFVKRKMRKEKSLKNVENRDEQFKYIANLRKEFTINNLPIFSIDTKKKEMIGNFYRDGKVYCIEPVKVNDHDFKSLSKGLVVPHGIYDITKNTCYLSIGKSKDTAEFVADNIEYHWNTSIKEQYPNATKILLLCDGGGSNSSRHHVVKEQFMKLSTRLKMDIVVAHYPPYCSKWNPIEHKAFSHITKSWDGVVFENYEVIKDFAEQAKAKNNFSVKAMINEKVYGGLKASAEFIKNYPVIFDDFLPKWNYKFCHLQ